MGDFNGIVIRRLEPGEINALVDFYNHLSAASKRTFNPLGQMTTPNECEQIARDNTLERDTKLDLVAWYNGRIVGWGFVWALDTDNPSFGLAIADSCQRRGLGNHLMSQVMRIARQRGLRRIELTVVQDNDTAQHVYERHGFVRTGEFVGDDGLAYWRMAASVSRVEPCERDTGQR